MRSLAKGEKIGGYIVTRQIGTTKYTQTYVVTDKKENKQYFLKLYVLNDTPTALKPYGHIREFECCKVLGYHANIYKYITDGKAEIDDEPVKYMVTQLSSGTLLSTYCSEHILSAEEILSIITGIIRAVLYVHGKGYWHLDINPSNIILEGNEESGFTPKLFDFEHAVLSNNSQP